MSGIGVNIPPGELNALRSVEELAGECCVGTFGLCDSSKTSESPSGYAISVLEDTE